MSFGEALVRARGQIIFLVGMTIASGAVVWLNKQDCIPASEVGPVPRLIFTPSAEMKEAWAYVERNRNATTGLVNADDGSGWTTIADTGDALRATIAAQRLRLITGREGYDRTSALLRALAALPETAATQRINTGTGERSDADVRPAGSVVDALELIAWSYPPSREAALQQLEKWRGAARAARAAGPVEPGALERHAAALVRAALSQRGES